MIHADVITGYGTGLTHGYDRGQGSTAGLRLNHAGGQGYGDGPRVRCIWYCAGVGHSDFEPLTATHTSWGAWGMSAKVEQGEARISDQGCVHLDVTLD